MSYTQDDVKAVADQLFRKYSLKKAIAHCVKRQADTGSWFWSDVLQELTS